MTFALWTILAVGVLPYICAGAAKFGGGGYDNAAPRTSLEQLDGWRQRADWAQRNHFEALPLFAAAVLTAHWVRAPQGMVDVLAGGFLLTRIGFSVAYIAGWASLRSLMWLVGFVCVVLLFCAGLR